MERRRLCWNAPNMVEALIRLEPPAFLTPEVRAWISQRPGLTLSRGRDEAGRSALLLRLRVAGEPGAADDEIGDLLTDLRLLGLRPTLISADRAAAEAAALGPPPSAGGGRPGAA